MSVFDLIADIIPSQIIDPHFDREANRIQIIGTSTCSRPGILHQAIPDHWQFSMLLDSFEELVFEERIITIGGDCDGRIDSFKFDATK